ncbi:MAG TPA: prepilin-type N-terminal cleavage/methylation domain-containing protein [Planctomycetota bacterium]|nr:prepilin-type N-terminal cleavage/methylation domain-containing protein [Planctomycetota bacterium]
MRSIAGDRRRASSAQRRGFTLIEVMISTIFISVALLAAVGTLGTSLRMSRTVNEREVAQRAAAAVIQEIAATEFSKVLASYDADPSNDPSGAGTAPGASFAVAGLSPQKGAAATSVGRVLFPLVGAELREDFVSKDLGTPHDLNGDGVIDALNHRNDCTLLPVRVEIRWQGVDGNASSLSMTRLLCPR